MAACPPLPAGPAGAVSPWVGAGLAGGCNRPALPLTLAPWSGAGQGAGGYWAGEGGALCGWGAKGCRRPLPGFLHSFTFQILLNPNHLQPPQPWKSLYLPFCLVPQPLPLDGYGVTAPSGFGQCTQLLSGSLGW